MNSFLLVVPALVLVLNIIATYVVVKTYFEVKNRRLYQIVLIWFVPFFGAWLAIYINREEYFARKRSKLTGRLTEISDSEAVTHAAAVNEAD